MEEDKKEETEAKSETAETEVSDRMAKMEERMNKQDATISKKDAENKLLRTQLDDRSEEQNFSKALLGALSTQTGAPVEEVEGAVRQSQPDLAKEYEAIQAKSKQDKLDRDYATKAQEVHGQLVGMGFTDTTEEYWEVMGAIQSGQNKLADIKLGKLSPKEVKPITAEDEDKRIEEKARQMLEKEGVLKTDTSGASGGSARKFKAQDIEKMSPAEYQKNRKEIQEAYFKGEIDTSTYK